MIKEEFLSLVNQLNIVDFMGIKSFEYQTTILMHFIMISNLLLQEGSEQEGKHHTDITKFIEYLLQMITFSLIQLSLGSGTSLDNARTIVKKELSDSIIMYYLLMKAF